MRTLGFDIGGANIKVSNGAEWHATFPFELWRKPDRLASELSTILSACPVHDRIVITMTGELCDCYPNKRTGVESILAGATQALGTQVKVYLVNGFFGSTDLAREQWQLAAAANWHAIAVWAARLCPNQRGCSFDIGSTTSDIVPFANGIVASNSKSDLARLLSGELIYTGAARTPVSAICSTVKLRDKPVRLATEYFATILDAYLVLGLVPDHCDNRDTADGMPATRGNAIRRLARTLCSDDSELEAQEIVALADQIVSGQTSLLEAALDRQIRQVSGSPTIVVSGSGEWLAASIATRFEQVSVVRWSEQFENGGAASSAAAAAAIAQLANLAAVL